MLANKKCLCYCIFVRKVISHTIFNGSHRLVTSYMLPFVGVCVKKKIKFLQIKMKGQIQWKMKKK